MSEVLNANPTVRNASELPSRRRKSSTKADRDGVPEMFWKALSTDDAYDPFFDSDKPSSDSGSEEVEPIDEQEIYDLISSISDPEHPLSLGSLGVVNLPDISLKQLGRNLTVARVEITPTITHCSLATAIGLGIRVRLEQSLPPRFRVDVRIKEGTHSTADQVNKQLGDKERVAAALENQSLMAVVKKMLETCH